MGQDDLMLEREDRSYTIPKKYVCQQCVEDPYLKGLIRKQLTDVSCSYCNAKTRKAAPVASIMPSIADALFRNYSDATFAGCSFDREAPEPCYLMTQDALENLPLECHGNLMEDVANAFANQQWVAAPDDGLYLEAQAHEEWAWSWDKFSQTVKHQTRFHFSKKSKHSTGDTLLSAAEVLPFLGRLVRKHRMVKIVPASTVVFRARPRPVDDVWPLDAKNLGAPEPEKALAGRMNPAGISYFYTAFDEGTAIVEVLPLPPLRRLNVAVGRWRTTNDLRVVDFIGFNLPSVFDANKQRKHQGALFLCHFLNAISQPVHKGGAEHIDYVPTQVVSEYFSQAFGTSVKQRLDGLIYPSAVSSGGRNLVLFPRNAKLTGQFDQLELISANTQSFMVRPEFSNYLASPQTAAAKTRRPRKLIEKGETK